MTEPTRTPAADATALSTQPLRYAMALTVAVLVTLTGAEYTVPVATVGVEPSVV